MANSKKFNFSESIRTKNTVVGNVEIGKSSGDEINKDLDTMTEVTKDEDANSKNI